MRLLVFCLLFFLLLSNLVFAQLEGSTPDHQLAQIEVGTDKEGFQIIYPTSPRPDSAGVVVFLHGYGGTNPMYYGGWIYHLVTSGRTVIFPFYQDNLFQPSPEHFAPLSAKAIRQALDLLNIIDSLPKPLYEHIDYIGHSYGGVIAAQLSAQWDSFQLPQPGVLMLNMAGTGKLKEGILDTYEGIPEKTRLGVIVVEDDPVNGYDFSELVLQTTRQLPFKYWTILFNQKGTPRLKAQHNACCSRFPELDNGKRNYNYFRSLVAGKINNYDSEVFWSHFDWLQSHFLDNNKSWIAPSDKTYLEQVGEDEKGNDYSPLLIFTPDSLP